MRFTTVFLPKAFFVGAFLGLPLSSELATAARTQVAGDFFIDRLEGDDSNLLLRRNLRPSVVPTDCRANIRQVMCLVDPPKKKQDPLLRPCLPGGQSYASYFEALYDRSPENLQKMYCSLRVIFVEKDFEGTAYAGLIEDRHSKVLGAQMGIRKSVLDENLNLPLWASWKEQLSFGGVTDSYTLTPDLPTIETSTPHSEVNDFLYFATTHEFGHIFDFANHLNALTNCRSIEDSEEKECDLEAGTWGSISWRSNLHVKAESDFANRDRLCFYWCDGQTIDASLAPSLYGDLLRSPFISTYATRNIWDDFADSLAYFLSDANLQTRYTIRLKDASSFDIMAKLHSPAFATKYQYLVDFLNRRDLVYP